MTALQIQLVSSIHRWNGSQSKFSDSSTNGRNKVKEATDQLYDSLGISRLLFNSDNATTLKYSIKVDESVIFQLNKQISTWVTRKFTYKHKGTFRVRLLDVTTINQQEQYDKYIKGWAVWAT